MLVIAAASCAGPPLDWQDRSTTRGLGAYKESHYRAIGDEFVASTDWSGFVDDVEHRRVLFLGDHHRDGDLHARYLELLDSLRGAGVRTVLGLEAIGTDDEPTVARYLRGEISFDAMRETVRARWEGSWLDRTDLDSFFYRELIRRARRRGLPVFALEPTPRLPLANRDRAIAERVNEAAERWRDRVIVVVVGHAHLLGAGALVERVGRPSIAIGARMSPRLHQSYTERASWPGDFLTTDRGLWFLNPPPSGDSD